MYPIVSLFPNISIFSPTVAFLPIEASLSTVNDPPIVALLAVK